jgi:uncharacterized protein
MRWIRRVGLVMAMGLVGWVGVCAGQSASGQSKQPAAKDVVGDWKGVLSAGGSQLHLVLHVTKAQEDQLAATLDSVDQGAYAIPVSAISVKDGKLSMVVAAVQGTYEGMINKDATEIKGTWTQMQPLDLTWVKAAKDAGVKSGDGARQKTQDAGTETGGPGKNGANTEIGGPGKNATTVTAAEIEGAWMGTIDTGAIKLRVVFHITNSADGLKATMDSLDQGANGIPVTSVTLNGAALKIEMKRIDGVYEGKVNADKTTIDGTWTQRGMSKPLVLTRAKDAASWELKRPQNPVRPLPYREEEVSYENKVQGDTLAGTLTIPEGKGPFTAVLLITGSGPQDRDESLMGHKPFLVLSDWLTRKGIEVLRVDDRGVGKSTGVFETATTADFATDVEAGVAFLKTRPEVNPRKIGLIGHSEGGMIAPMVAARNADVGFIVMMAGSGVPGDQILVEQRTLIAEAGGMTTDEAEKDAVEEREVLALVVKEKDSPDLQKDLKERLAEDVKEPELGAQVKVLTSPWFRYFLAYDPGPALRKVKCPVLALNGSKDLQVSPKQNLPAIRAALEEGGNKNFEVVELPGLNHLFQTAVTGAPSEYAKIEETMSPVAMEKISGWIGKLP